MEEKSTNIKERVLQFANSKGVSYETFFTNIGMSYGNFKGKSKKTPLNSKAIADIFAIYPDLDLEWLLTGVRKKQRGVNSLRGSEVEPLGEAVKQRDEIIALLKDKIRLLEEKIERLEEEPYRIKKERVEMPIVQDEAGRGESPARIAKKEGKRKGLRT